jgi:hypothetical protein
MDNRNDTSASYGTSLHENPLHAPHSRNSVRHDLGGCIGCIGCMGTSDGGGKGWDVCTGMSTGMGMGTGRICVCDGTADVDDCSDDSKCVVRAAKTADMALTEALPKL